ncbi:MFS transporter [Siccirubricoccus sp. KC 17139]|uniref:MFS transporter n=1 Tax=Siccirubricoccus soli TaxID=2899147 RepID=A0ABT1DAY1_9PROT|nr:MFS transporter [Siccirubricoccus soli]MCO6419091.1 MFS transporter [Siccirubricoccus soli]MCP2685226.1 MFS transporter [Siccirubricoccus soli]
MSEAKPPVARPAARWIIVGAVAVLLAIAMGQLVNGLSVFFVPLELEFGWPRGAIALINSAGLVGLALGGILMGMVADRAGVRRVALAGAGAVGLCVLLAAGASQLWQFYLLFFLAGLLGAGLFAPLLSLVGNWFPAGAGLAIGIASAGQAVGQGGVPFATAFLIEAVGWRQAFLVQGAVSLAVMLPLALLMREPPRPARGQAGAVAAAPPLPPWVAVPWLSLAVIGCCTCMAVPLMHLVPLIHGHHISSPDAGGVLFVMLLAAILGRIAFGRLADHVGAIPAYVTASFWQTVAVFAFTRIHDLGQFYLFAPIYGFGYAGVMTGVLVTARMLTPVEGRAAMMGVIIAFAWLGHGFGGFQGGWLFDVTGDYTLSFAMAALAGVMNLMLVGSLFLAVRRRRRQGLALA